MDDAPEDPSCGPPWKEDNDLPSLKPEVRCAGDTSKLEASEDVLGGSQTG